jgi:Ornithine cyclodeaminase/mu-crystallin family
VADLGTGSGVLTPLYLSYLNALDVEALVLSDERYQGAFPPPREREAFAERLSRDLEKPVQATQDWHDCVADADIIVEASRLTEPAPMLKTEWIKKGAFVVPYGTMIGHRLRYA